VLISQHRSRKKKTTEPTNGSESNRQGGRRGKTIRTLGGLKGGGITGENRPSWEKKRLTFTLFGRGIWSREIGLGVLGGEHR